MMEMDLLPALAGEATERREQEVEAAGDAAAEAEAEVAGEAAVQER